MNRPELFPGLSFRPNMDKQLIMNVFASGKCVLTGAKNYSQLLFLMSEFRKCIGNDVFW